MFAVIDPDPRFIGIHDRMIHDPERGRQAACQGQDEQNFSEQGLFERSNAAKDANSQHRGKFDGVLCRDPPH